MISFRNLHLTSSVVCCDQYDAVVVNTRLLQFDDNLVNSLVHTSKHHVTKVVGTLLKSVFPRFVTDHLSELPRRNSDKGSMDCHEGEVEEQRLTLVVLLNYLLGFLQISIITCPTFTPN